MMPGDTHTDPNMQKNALEYAQAVAVRAAPPGCKQLAFVDTRFDGYCRPAEPRGARWPREPVRGAKSGR